MPKLNLPPPPVLPDSGDESGADSLRERVYSYLNDCIVNDRLRPGDFLDQDSICRELAVSKAPLRDALIRLQVEGFVTILPRRGVYITPITMEFIKSAYQIIGSIEADCLRQVFHQLTPEHIHQFEASNAVQMEYLRQSDFKAYNVENVHFHRIFLDLSGNILLDKVIEPLRRRLYDFPRRSYSLEWELFNLQQHRRFIDSVKIGNLEAAVSIFRNEHWSFAVHRQYINTYSIVMDNE